MVKSALAKLPEKHRQVLEMAYFDGLSQTEIARALDAPLGTVKSWARNKNFGKQPRLVAVD